MGNGQWGKTHGEFQFQTILAAVIASSTASSLQKVFVPLDFSPDQYSPSDSEENVIDYNRGGAPIFNPRSQAELGKITILISRKDRPSHRS